MRRKKKRQQRKREMGWWWGMWRGTCSSRKCEEEEEKAAEEEREWGLGENYPISPLFMLSLSHPCLPSCPLLTSHLLPPSSARDGLHRRIQSLEQDNRVDVALAGMRDFQVFRREVVADEEAGKARMESFEKMVGRQRGLGRGGWALVKG